MLDILIVVLTAAIVWGLLTNNDDYDDGGPLNNYEYEKWLGAKRPCINRRKHHQWS
jgi:hypothetical protein